MQNANRQIFLACPYDGACNVQLRVVITMAGQEDACFNNSDTKKMVMLTTERMLLTIDRGMMMLSVEKKR